MPSRHSAGRLPILTIALGAYLAGCQDAQLTEVENPPVSMDRSALASCRAGGDVLAKYVSAIAMAEGQRVSLSQNAATNVRGAGDAVVTDETGSTYTAKVAVAAGLNESGVAHGSINFVFDRGFSAFWGAVPGVHAIHLVGKVASMTTANGVVTLAGTALETDVAPGGGPLFFPNEPFEVVISAPNQLTLQWCLLPAFDLQMTTGSFEF